MKQGSGDAGTTGRNRSRHKQGMGGETLRQALHDRTWREARVCRRAPAANEFEEEGHMCPACIESTVVIVAGAGSAGGILAVCIGKFRKFFGASSLGLFHKGKEK
jgi:hypothetical protein